MYSLLRPLLFCLDAETAHHVTLAGANWAERWGISRRIFPGGPIASGGVRCLGLEFPNRVGLAAGLDKTGAAIDALGSLGFGFIEIGTLTPRPQPGNPKPRLFRIVEKEAIINRMGFNNPGIVAGVANAKRRRYAGVLGINIGKNFDTPNERAIEDYLICQREAWPVADYLVVNLSSPNTKGLRDLQQVESCRALIRALRSAHEPLRQQHGRNVPVLIKIAPDLTLDHLSALARVFCEEKLDGVIATNTTLSRDGVENLKNGAETGGLSGAPLTERATAIIAALAREIDGALPIIGVGGILSGADARAKLQAGATLVQIYTGLIYRGPKLVSEVVKTTANI